MPLNMNRPKLAPFVFALACHGQPKDIEPLTDEQSQHVAQAIDSLCSTVDFNVAVASIANDKAIFGGDGTPGIEAYAQTMSDICDFARSDLADNNYYTFDPSQSTGMYTHNVGGENPGTGHKILLSRDIFSFDPVSVSYGLQLVIAHEEAHEFGSHSLEYMRASDWYTQSTDTQEVADIAYADKDFAATLNYHAHGAVTLFEFSKIAAIYAIGFMESDYIQYIRAIEAGEEVDPPRFVNAMPPLDFDDVWSYAFAGLWGTSSEVPSDQDIFMRRYYTERLGVSIPDLKEQYATVMWPAIQDYYEQCYQDLLSRLELRVVKEVDESFIDREKYPIHPTAPFSKMR